jgi:hypothetical protein
MQNAIRQISSEDIRTLAQNYLCFDKMCKIIVCDKELLE